MHVVTKGDAQILQEPSRRVIGPSQRPLPNNTHKTQATNIHTTRGILTRNPRKREAANKRADIGIG